MAKGDHLKNYKGPRGRVNKDNLLGFTVSTFVEFTMPRTGEFAYGKIIEFKQKPEGILVEISVKALKGDDGSWVRYHDYYDFKYVPVSDVARAPVGVLQERIKVTAKQKEGEINER